MRIHAESWAMYSQFYIADVAMAVNLDYFNDEVAGHYDQGFSVRRGSVSLTTYCDDEYTLTITDEPPQPTDLEKAIFAIKIPCQFDSGVAFITGMQDMLEEEWATAAILAPESLSQEFLQSLADDKLIYLFPVKGVTAVTFVELPGYNVQLHFERGESSDVQLLVPHEHFPRQSDFLMDVLPFTT